MIMQPQLDTLLDMAANAIGRDQVKRGAVTELLAWSNFLRVLPFVTASGGQYNYPEQEGRHAELLKIAGGDLDVDKADIRRESSERSKQEAAQIRKISRYLNRVLIEGDSRKDPRDPDGLRRRVRPSHTVEGPVNAATLTAALKLVPRATHLLIAGTTLQEYRFPVVWDKDDFGNRCASFGWADDENAHLTPIILAGLDENERPVLPHGAFVLRLNADGVHGVQNNPPEVDDLGEIQSKPVLRTRVEWLVNLADHPDSIAFITG